MPDPSQLAAFMNQIGREPDSGVAFLDEHGRYLFISEGLARVNGRSIEEHLGRTIEEVLPAP